MIIKSFDIKNVKIIYLESNLFIYQYYLFISNFVSLYLSDIVNCVALIVFLIYFTKFEFLNTSIPTIKLFIL